MVMVVFPWSRAHLCQSNPILDIDESLLSEEEPVSMATGEDEEGAISEISNTDVLEDTHPKLKVSVELENIPVSPLPPPSFWRGCYGICDWFTLWITTVL